MDSSATAIFAISLGGVFAAVVVSVLVVAKRRKAATDRQLGIQRDGATDGT